MFKIKLMGDDSGLIRDVEFSIYQHAVYKYNPRSRSYHMGAIFHEYWRGQGFETVLGWVLWHTKKSIAEDPEEKSKFEQELKKFNLLVYIYDITNPEGLEGLKSWLELEGNKKAAKIILGANLEKEQDRKITRDQATQFANDCGASYFEVRAAEGKCETNKSVKQLMKALKEKAEEQQQAGVDAFLNVLKEGGDIKSLIEDVKANSADSSLKSSKVQYWISLQDKFVAKLKPQLLDDLVPLIEGATPEVKRVLQIILVYCAKVNSSSNLDQKEDIDRENENLSKFFESLSRCKKLTEATLKKVYENQVKSAYSDVYLNLRSAHKWFIEPQIDMKTVAQKNEEAEKAKKELGKRIAEDERREKEREDDFKNFIDILTKASLAETKNELGVGSNQDAAENKDVDSVVTKAGVKKNPVLSESNEDESISKSNEKTKENLELKVKAHKKAIEILGKSAHTVNPEGESSQLVSLSIFREEWNAYGSPLLKGEDLAKNVLGFVQALYEDEEESDFELNVEGLDQEIQHALRNLLAYAGKLQGDYAALESGSKKESLENKLESLRNFMQMILSQKDLTPDSLEVAYDEFQKNDKNNGTGFYRLHSFFYNKRYDGWHLVKSTSGELVYNLMETIKKHSQNSGVDDDMDDVHPN